MNRRQPNTTLSAFDLGIAPYLPTHEIQRQIQEGIVGGSHPGVLLLLSILLSSRWGAKGEYRTSCRPKALPRRFPSSTLREEERPHSMHLDSWSATRSCPFLAET